MKAFIKIVFFLIFTTSLNGSNFELTTQEREYLDSKRVIKVHAEKDWAPFNFISENIATGLSNDYMRLLAKKLDIDIEFVRGYTWKEYMEMLRTNKLDIISNMTITEDRKKRYIFSDKPILSVYLGIFSNKSNAYASLDELIGKKVAIVRGYDMQEYLSKNYPNIEHVLVNSNEDIFKVLLAGEADAALGTSAVLSYIVFKNFITDIVHKPLVTKYFPMKPQHIGFSKDNIVLRDIINKGMQKISREELDNLNSKWLKYINKDNPYKNRIISLTTEEKNYIKDKKVLTVCSLKNNIPYDAVVDGTIIGISGEYLNLISNKTGLPIKVIESKTLDEMLKRVKNRECDIKTTHIDKEFSIPYICSDSYLVDNITLITRIEEPYINNFKDYLDRKYVLLKSSSDIIKYLKNRYPNIDIILVDSVQEALAKVESQDVFGYIDKFLSSTYNIQKYYPTRLKIMKDLKDSRISFGVSNDNLTLYSIINKALNSIEEKQRIKIRNNWSSITVEKPIDYSYLWYLLLFIFIVILFFVLKQYMIQQSIKEFNELINATMEGMIIFKDDLCMEINNEALRLFDFKFKKDALGLSILDFIANDSIEKVKYNIKNSSVETYEVNVQKRNGDIFSALLKGHTRVNNNVVYRILSFIDLTQLKEKEIALERAKNRAEAATKSKSEFLANMSHEIRTPMNAVLGMSHLVLQTNLSKKQKHYIDRIDNSAKILLGILNDILDFSKIEAGKLSIEKIDFSMKDILDKIRNIVELKVLEKGLEFNIIFDDYKNNKIFYGDQLRLTQILINLINNAIKFTKSGQIDVEVILLNSDIVRFSVTDTGIGLSPMQKDKLFRPFSQADGSTTREYGGTGLGLSISKKLVELMNGKIWIESEIGVGSSFIFEIYLPKGDASSIKSSSYKNSDKLNIDFSNNSILLVDDNSINQEIVLGLLSNSGLDIDIANNGLEALEKYRANQSKYRLIFMDIQMPIMDGYEATKRIREIDKNIPIVALTANAMKEDVKRTKEAGMNAHLNKPIEINKLYDILGEYITIELDSSTKSIDNYNSDEVIPKFNTIDIDIGLKYLMGDKKSYLKILRDFKKSYVNFSFDTLDNKELLRVMHTIKGLSASIGAISLNNISIEFEKSKDKSILPKFAKELNSVINEIDIKLEEIELDITNRDLISKELRDELFNKLKDAITIERIQLCKPILDELSKYKLLESDAKILKDINQALDEFDFDLALDIVLNKDCK